MSKRYRALILEITILKMTETKEKILEATFALLAERGYNGVSLGDIASKLSVARSLPYKYFSSKNDLFFEVFKHYFFERFFYDIDDSKKISFDEFIFTITTRFEEMMNRLEIVGVSVFDYNALYVSALKNEPRFNDYMLSQMNRFKYVISDAYENGEIVGVPMDFVGRVFTDIWARCSSLEENVSNAENIAKIVTDIQTFVKLVRGKCAD